MNGLLVEVTETRLGSQAVASAVVGDTTVAVEDVNDFADDGGIVDILGQRYDYTTVTPDPETVDAATGDVASSGTLTLATGLTVAVDEYDPVLLVVGGDIATIATAVVDIPAGEDSTTPDGGDPVHIQLTYEQRAMYPVGPYDPPLPVILSDDLTSLTGPDGVRPSIDGSTIDPATLPDTSQPVTPPASTPDLTVSAGPDFFVLRVANTDAEWASATIEYHVSTDPSFTPTVGDTTTMVGASRGVVVTNALPDGSTYELGTQYYFAAIATNVAGSAPATPAVSAQLDPSALENIIANQIVAGYILTGRIQFGQGYIDANEGVVLPQPDGTTTRFPVDGVTPSTISGFLIANGMAVNDGAFFYGLSQITGKMLLNVGVPNPSKKPDVTYAWPLVQPAATMQYGLAATSDGKGLVSLVMSNGDLIYNVVDASTGGLLHSNTIAAASIFTPAGGLTRVGGNYYALGQNSAVRNQWEMHVYSGADIEAGNVPALVTSYLVVPSGSLGNYPKGLTVGTDGTGVIVAWIDPNKHLRSYTTDTNGANSVAGANVPINAIYKLAGVVVPPNVSCLYFLCASNSKVFAVNLSALTAEATTREFAPASTSGNTGMTWDGNNIRTLTSGGVYTYSNLVTNSSFRAGYTWYDGNTTGSGTHETARSPQYVGTWPARTFATVTSQPPPHTDTVDTSQGDAATLIRTYATFGTDAGALQGTQTDTALMLAGVDSTGAAPPAASNFATSLVAAGRLQSEAVDSSGAAFVDLSGDGSARIGSLTTDTTGAARFGAAGSLLGLLGGIQWGSVVVDMGGAASTSGSVTFPRAFHSPPMIFVSLQTAVGQKLIPAISSGTQPTATGFTWAVKTGDGTVSSAGPTLYWLAIGGA